MAINSAFINALARRLKRVGHQLPLPQRGLGAQPNFQEASRQGRNPSLWRWTLGVGRWTLDVEMSRASAFAFVFLCWAAIYLPGLGTLEIKGEEGRRILPAVARSEERRVGKECRS